MKKKLTALAVAGFALSVERQPAPHHWLQPLPLKRLKKNRFKSHRKGK